MNTTKKLNPLCPVCNNIPWSSTVSPKCICVQSNFKNKEPETITIKKSLWDEMLSYKKRIDELEEWNNHSVKDQEMNYKAINDRIDKLENFLPDLLQDFEKRIIKLEEKVNSIDKICDTICN